MELREWMSRFSSWWNAEHDVVVGNDEDAHSAYRDALAREVLSEAQLLFRKMQYAQDQEREACQQQVELKEQLAVLRSQSQQSVDLPSGESVEVDLSQGHLWERFWRDCDEALQETPSLPEPKKMSAPQLEVIQQEAKVRFQQSVREQLYDKRFADQETDELLHLLSS